MAFGWMLILNSAQRQGGWRSKDLKQKIMRKILIELQIDWEGYEDVSDELIVEDAIEAKVEGVGWTLLRQPPVVRSCRSCGEEWKDDFWCSSSSRLCLNCCPNAYGMATCCGGVCKPIEQKAKPATVDDDLPF